MSLQTLIGLILIVSSIGEIVNVSPNDGGFWTEGRYKDLELRVGDSIQFYSHWMIHNLWHSTNTDNLNVQSDYSNCDLTRIEHHWSKLSCDCTATAPFLPPFLRACAFPSATGETCPNGGSPEFTLTYQFLTSGDHYFACSAGDHCELGMKFRVRVSSRPAHYGFDNGDFGPNVVTVPAPLRTDVPQWIVSSYPNKVAKTGDYLRFVYDTSHNVYQWNGTNPFPSAGFPAACSQSQGWVKIADNDWGTAPRGFLFPLTNAGVYYFACLEPQHCEAGMHFAVTTTKRFPVRSPPSKRRCRHCRGGGEGGEGGEGNEEGEGHGEGRSRTRPSASH